MTLIIVLGCLVVLLGLFVVTIILFLPWMDRWKTTIEEREKVFPGDDLLVNPCRVTNRAVTINAPAERVFAWIVQIGADKSGMYSYTWLENLVGCKMAKVEIIKPEWQNLKADDLMKMCAGDFAPPPYIVARVLKNQAVIYGHKDEKGWQELWQFVLDPRAGNSTRLITRNSTNMTGGMWEVIRPISFLMERKMLLTIKKLSER